MPVCDNVPEMDKDATTGRSALSAIHLDAVGGIAGDMFAAAILDICPDFWPHCRAALDAVNLPQNVEASAQGHNDGVFTGTRFVVDGVPDEASGLHTHIHWSSIRKTLQEAPLDAGVRDTALGIFGALAEAEGAIHGCDPDKVTFHEVGAYDSIADIVCAAAIIQAAGDCRWSIGAIPRGRGQVRSQHGVLPVPAPATVALLKGYALADDGEDGERVTPTGAAIINYLKPTQEPDPVPRCLIGAGIGFGTRKLKSRSNILRATLYSDTADGLSSDTVEVLRCEIDDQTPEDLAVAIDRLRSADGVIDVCQWPVFGKKGRMAVALQVLARPERGDGIVSALLNETTTLGVRRNLSARTILERTGITIGGKSVKRAHRPTGVTFKAEQNDLATIEGHTARQTERQRLEQAARKTHEQD